MDSKQRGRRTPLWIAVGLLWTGMNDATSTPRMRYHGRAMSRNFAKRVSDDAVLASVRGSSRTPDRTAQPEAPTS